MGFGSFFGVISRHRERGVHWRPTPHVRVGPGDAIVLKDFWDAAPVSKVPILEKGFNRTHWCMLEREGNNVLHPLNGV